MRVKESSYLFRLTVTIIHLAFWAELGVVTREFLDKLFQLGCDENWGPCLKASTTLGLKNDKPLAVLPRKHPWQRNFELQIGIRTGFCGSLTTFASWQLEMMTRAIDNSEWISMVASFIIGLYCALLSYVLGTHTALYIDRWYLPDQEDVLRQTLKYKEEELRALEEFEHATDEAEIRHVRAARADTLEAELENWEPDIPSNVPALRQASLRRRSSRLRGGGSALLSVAEVHGSPSSSMASPGLHSAHGRRDAPATGHIYPTVIVEDDEPGSALPLGGARSGSSTQAGQQTGAGAVPRIETAAALIGPSPFAVPDQSQASACKGALPPAEPSTISQGLLEAEGKQGLRLASSVSTAFSLGKAVLHSKTDLAALLGLLILSAGLGAGVGLEREHTWLRQIWLAGLFAPYGCTLRWWLSRFNYKLKGVLAWFPTGTFMANMLGTGIDFGLQCIVQRRGSALSYWGSLVITSIQKGYCGSLTTVSTFITEVVKFAELFPETTHAYLYSIVSLGGGAFLGIALYGWSVWA